MALTFDPEKNAKNLAERDLSFELVETLDWETAQIKPDLRKDYSEARLRVLAFLGGRLHAAVISPRGEDLRVISFRKANRREVRQYEEENLRISSVSTR